MRFLTQSLLATLVVVMASTPTSAQTLPPSLSGAATACNDGCADQCGLLSAGFACGENCNGGCDGCGPSGCSCDRCPSCWGRRTGWLGRWASDSGGRSGCCRRQGNCCEKRADCCGGQSDCCSGQSDCCARNDCCRERADCCGGGRRSGGCFIGTLLGDVKQVVDTAVVGCTPWTDWRTPYSDESAFLYADSNGVTQAKEGVAAEKHGAAAGIDRVTKERDGVEVVPRDQWPAEYRDAPVPSPPNLTRSAIKLGPYGYATYQTRAPAMQLRIAAGDADDRPTGQVTAWVADAEEPQQEDVTVVTDLNE